MNCLKQRQIVSGFDKKHVQPYVDSAEVELPFNPYALSPELYKNDINHMCNQLIDNDKFIYRAICQLSNYQDGIKSYDENNVRYRKDGYKFMTNENQVNFHRKHVLTQSEFEKLQIFSQPSFWIEHLNSTYFVGTDNGIFWNNDTDVINTQWEQDWTNENYDKQNNVNIVSTYIKLPTQLLAQINSLSANEDSTQFNESTFLVQISSDISSSNVYDNFPKACSISYREDDKSLWFSLNNTNNMLSTKLNTAGMLQDGISVSVVDELLCSVHINDVDFIQLTKYGHENLSTNIIFGTNRGLYKSERIEYNSSNTATVFCCSLLSSLFNRNIEKIEKFDNTKYLLYAVDGLYMYIYDENQNLNTIYKLSYFPGYVNSMSQYTGNDSLVHYVQDYGDFVQESTNLRKWNNVLCANVNSQAEFKINQIKALNEQTWIFATSDGLITPLYEYEDLIDSVRFTIDDVYNMYYDKDEFIQNSVSASLNQQHIIDNHNPEGFYQKINDNYMDVSFSNICSFTETDITSKGESTTVSTLYSTNDYIHKVVFGNTSDNDDIKVQIKNFVTNDIWTEVEADYIIKLWNSGLNEFEIYIPTTQTYYLAHNAGVPGCQYSQFDVFKRANLYQARLRNSELIDKTSSQLSTHYTEIKVSILSTQYDITQVLNTNINGNSLPLNIYREKDEQSQFSPATKFYHSFIEPSLFKNNYQLTSTTDEYYEFNGCCFGTDAQAIELMTMTSTTKYYDGNVLSVMYHGNGRLDSKGRESYIQKIRILEDGTINQQIKNNMFDSNGQILYGWSFTRNPINNRIEYADKMTDDLLKIEDFKNKTILHLYAVWLTVDWNESHTELEMDI